MGGAVSYERGTPVLALAGIRRRVAHIKAIGKDDLLPLRGVVGGTWSSRNVNRFRGGLVFKAHRLVYHSTLGLRVIKKKKKSSRRRAARGREGARLTNVRALCGVNLVT